jgi:heme o synthase
VPARAADWLTLTKPRITTLVVVTTLAGYLLPPGSEPIDGLRLLAALLGTALLASGASALNQVIERDRDARMDRTAARPVPAGRVHADGALAFAVGLVIAGLAVLVVGTNTLTAGLGALTVAGYAFVYTPLKPITSLSTIVGAAPGALPPMMGWAAARGAVEPGAWALFGLLFVWQLPHFLAIAWMYREDYGRGGFPMLTVEDTDGRRTALQALLWTAALLPVSLLPSILHLAGLFYFISALLLGCGLLATVVRFSRAPQRHTARTVLLASVLYLPAVLLALLVDRLLP